MRRIVVSSALLVTVIIFAGFAYEVHVRRLESDYVEDFSGLCKRAVAQGLSPRQVVRIVRGELGTNVSVGTDEAVQVPEYAGNEMPEAVDKLSSIAFSVRLHSFLRGHHGVLPVIAVVDFTDGVATGWGVHAGFEQRASSGLPPKSEDKVK